MAQSSLAEGELKPVEHTQYKKVKNFFVLKTKFNGGTEA